MQELWVNMARIYTEDCIDNIRKFFNGDSLEHALSELDFLKETLITENYGELERNDKWLMIDFLRRVDTLISAAHHIFKNIDNGDRIKTEN